MNWLPLLIVGWVSFGMGMAFASWMIVGDQDRIRVERIMPPHEFVGRMARGSPKECFDLGYHSPSQNTANSFWDCKP